VIVTVSEGEVAVRPMQPGQAEDANQRPISLKANQQLVLSPMSPPKFVERVDAARELKWLHDWVEADGDTLGQMVAELNRRNEVQIVIDVPLARNFRVVKLGFKPSQPEALVQHANDWYRTYPGKAPDKNVAVRLERP
jgi:ferric-dicitrate binding protein FerR (iron transport regulator)